MRRINLGMSVAEDLISSQVKGAVALVLSHITQEIKLAWGFNKDLKELQAQLIRLYELLEGVDQHSCSAFPSPVNRLLKQWLHMVKDAAYDTDDLFDDYSYKALKQRSALKAPRNSTLAVTKANRWIKTKVVGMKRVGFRVRMAHKVKELRESIDGIYKTANQLGIKPVKVAAGSANSYSDAAGISSGYDDIRLAKRLRDLREWVDDKGLVGRDEDLDMVVRLLCHPTNCDRDLTIVGIVGMPGLGKTSLCKLMSKTEQVKEYFSRQIIWVVVAHNFDLAGLLNKMVESLYGRASNMSDSHVIVENLKERLNSKKYLLILDDVWGTLDWESLKNCLIEIGGAKGTAILVTSREKHVVAMMETDSYGCDRRRIITKPYVYDLKGINKDDSWFLFKQRLVDDEDFGTNPEKKQMASRMLRKCGGVPLAIRVLGDLLRDKSMSKWKEIEESEIWDKDDRHGILPSLQLSFHYLPDVAVKRCFSYCAIFPEDAVIEKEKLIQMWMAQGFMQPYDEMEIAGDKYFHILLNSSLFLEVDMDIHGNVTTCKMHDLVWYLARVVSGGECLHLPKQSKIKDGSSEVRHVSIASCYDKLKASEFPKLQLPDSSSSLKHLRYLDISGNRFKKVPNMITELYHLQTLSIAHNRVVFTKKFVFPLLPKEFSNNLVNLRHICTDEMSNFEGIGIPKGMGHLSALQTVPTIDLKKGWGGKVSELGSLNNLKGLLKQSLQYLQSKEEAKSLNLSSKRNLAHLSLEWCLSEEDEQHDEEVFEGLQPGDRLDGLEVRGYGGIRFPQWMMEMKGFGGSPLCNLVSLTITDCAYAKGHLIMNNLPSLRFLSIVYCLELSLSFPSHGFECCKLLKKLIIRKCPRVALPDMSPLIHLHELLLDGMTSEVVGLTNLPALSQMSINYLHQEMDEGDYD